MPYCGKCGQYASDLTNCGGCRYLARVESARRNRRCAECKKPVTGCENWCSQCWDEYRAQKGWLRPKGQGKGQAKARPEDDLPQQDSAASSGGDRNPWTPPEEAKYDWTPIDSPRESGTAAASSGSQSADAARVRAAKLARQKETLQEKKSNSRTGIQK